MRSLSLLHAKFHCHWLEYGQWKVVNFNMYYRRRWAINEPWISNSRKRPLVWKGLFSRSRMESLKECNFTLVHCMHHLFDNITFHQVLFQYELPIIWRNDLNESQAHSFFLHFFQPAVETVECAFGKESCMQLRKRMELWFVWRNEKGGCPHPHPSISQI